MIFEKISNYFIDKLTKCAYIIFRFEKISNYIKMTAHTGGLTQGGDGWQKKKEVEHVRVQAEKPPEQKPSTTQ